ncbi:MAG: hypothetical protein GXO83_11345 [Chlorobi bacterium]|nr:hypothetical protein [Chlorobiota bacterium]
MKAKWAEKLQNRKFLSLQYVSYSGLTAVVSDLLPYINIPDNVRRSFERSTVST